MNNNIEIDQDLKRLIESHPRLFRGQAPAIPSYVSAGWYALIDTLCSDIETVLGSEACVYFEVRQIKQKFGTLRFYYRLGECVDIHVDVMSSQGRQHFVGRQAGNDKVQEVHAARVRELVDTTCAASESVCEKCGASAQLHDLGGYLTTLCDQHLAEVMANRSRRTS